MHGNDEARTRNAESLAIEILGAAIAAGRGRDAFTEGGTPLLLLTPHSLLFLQLEALKSLLQAVTS